MKGREINLDALDEDLLAELAALVLERVITQEEADRLAEKIKAGVGK